MIEDGLNMLGQSSSVEVQERATSSLKLLSLMDDLRTSSRSISLVSLFDEELNPVASKAQRKVPVPEGLDLDEWINEPIRTPTHSDMDSDIGLPDAFSKPRRRHRRKKGGDVSSDDEDAAEQARRAEEEMKRVCRISHEVTH